MLSPTSRKQVVMSLSINTVNDFFEQDCCIESLDATNILSSRWTLKPRFCNARVAHKSPPKVESDMTSFTTIFEMTVPANANMSPLF